MKINTLTIRNIIKEELESIMNPQQIPTPKSMGFERLGLSVAEGAFLGAVFGYIASTVIPVAVKTYAVNQATKAVSSLLGNTMKPPQPKTQAQKDKSISGAFNNITNTVNAGTAIPLLYGETIVGSIVVSSAVDSVQFSGKGKEKYNI